MVDILIISSVHSKSDIRVVKKELATLVDAYGPNVKYCCFEKSVDKDLDDTTYLSNSILVKKDAIRNRFIRMLVRPIRLAKLIVSERPQILHFHDPELLPLAAIASLFGIAVIYDAHENISKQILSKPYLGKHSRLYISRIINFFEKVCVRRMHVIAATTEIADQLDKCALSAVVVRNRPLRYELDLVDSFKSHRKSDNSKFEIFYAGAISEIRGIKTILSALELLGDEFQLNLLGRFNTEELYLTCQKARGWEKVKYYGQLSRTEMYEVSSRSDIALTLFHPVPNHLDALPNKIFEYFAAQKPVLISDFPYWRLEFAAYHGVYYTNPLSPEDIAFNIELLYNKRGQLRAEGLKNRNALYASETWENEAQTLLQLYSRIYD